MFVYFMYVHVQICVDIHAHMVIHEDAYLYLHARKYKL